jgi:hypothetical protein
LPKHTTCLQKLYWAPFHWIEESTTGLCLFPLTIQYSLQSISMSLLCRFTSLKMWDYMCMVIPHLTSHHPFMQIGQTMCSVSLQP